MIRIRSAPRLPARLLGALCVLFGAGPALADALKVAVDPPKETGSAVIARTALESPPPAAPRLRWKGCGSDPMRIGSADARIRTVLQRRRMGDVEVVVDCGVGQLTVRLADLEDQQPLGGDPTGDPGLDRLARRVLFTIDQLAWRLVDAGRPVPALPGPRWAFHGRVGVRALPESGMMQNTLHFDLGRALTDWLWLRTGLGMGFSGGTAIDGGELTLVSGTALLGAEVRLAGSGWSTGLTVGGRGGIGFALTRAEDATLDEDRIGAWGGPVVQAATAAVMLWPLEVRVVGELGWAIAPHDGELAGVSHPAFRGMWIGTSAAIGAVF